MSKLAAEKKFFDVSDYGRPFAVAFATRIKHTSITPVHVTFLFGICGLVAVFCIVNRFFIAAGFFLILKSIIDAADGELARLKKTPSYTGRYLDSVFDNVLNFLFLMSVCYISEATIWLSLLAFACLQLQGTLYNYYYVILRNNSDGGDTTSKIFETQIPKAFLGENQKTVNILFTLYIILYGLYDKIIYALDRQASTIKSFPNWFMTLVSFYGLGFQLMLMAILLAVGWSEFIIPFFIAYSLPIVVLIGIRKVFL